MGHRGRQKAQVIVWVAVMLPFFLAIAGLTIDAGQIFDARRDAQNIADGAARVAVEQVDRNALRNNGILQLDYDQARNAAAQYIHDQEHGPGWRAPKISADVGGGTTVTGVTVSVSRDVPTSFMRIVKVASTVTVSASAHGVACVGLGPRTTTLSGGSC